ncbi:hypothetical protein DM02DRAFT_693418 [Periconia macrospinosa]|uniref:RING-CH-type domain-containing protein n=1 Tax=Periconia macrospinosa TaxID=97972 RepID=A0A2V1D8F2_9PLEO|nr:hypothetical protein DM02DRAFT_693418 [Periconia macrospinosa]
MSYNTGSNPTPEWDWENVPKEEATTEEGIPSRRRTPYSFSATDQPSEQDPSHEEASHTESPRSNQDAGSSKRSHWPPRQCRICLETVQPTFDAPSEYLPGFMQTTSNVKYEDESGRLLRPCLCKGSSKYVHESCLQAWRHADSSYGPRNYYHCPTCGFKYRLARLGAGRFVASIAAQIILTIIILVLAVFVLGFIADPIINLYLDPWGFLSPWSRYDEYYYYDDEEAVGWVEHFAKGIASMGVLGFAKFFFARPFSWIRFGSSGRGRTTGRDRHEQISWLVILIGVGTVLLAIYKGVRAWSRRTLERAGERVMDVQGDDGDEDVTEE